MSIACSWHPSFPWVSTGALLEFNSPSHNVVGSIYRYYNHVTVGGGPLVRSSRLGPK